MRRKNLFFAGAISLLCVTFLLCSAHNRSIVIHLRGVSETNISLISVSGSKPYRPVTGVANITNGKTTTLLVPVSSLPSEFVLRFDYKKSAESNPYPSEKHIFIGSQNLEIWTNPMYANNNDSTWFQKGEKENSVFTRFVKANLQKKENLAVLENFLLKYDDTNSEVYRQCIAEYERRRTNYNLWLQKQKEMYKDCFVSKMFQFQFVPPTDWTGNEQDRVQSIMNHYFDGIDFKETAILKTADMNNFMDRYVNIYGALSTTVNLRDSLFSVAGKMAIEKARTGNPSVYGWMVDYFFNGYEANGIQAGMTMLAPYLNDPDCLTEKRKQIEKRLQGIKSLKPNTLVPDFEYMNKNGKTLKFHDFRTATKYKLVIFWSADCNHCKELVEKLYPWSVSKNKLLTVFALSVDKTATEIPKWEKAIQQLPEWNHRLCEGGVNSKEANDFFVLSTPTMILVDSKTNKIISLPERLEDLTKSVK